MHTRRLVLLFSLIILFGFCSGMLCWAEGMIVYAYRGTSYMMRPNDTIPTRITEEGISTPSPDGRFLAAVDRDPDRRNILHIRDLHTGRKIRSIILQVHSYVDISWSPDGRWIVYAGNIERLRAGRDLGHRNFSNFAGWATEAKITPPHRRKTDRFRLGSRCAICVLQSRGNRPAAGNLGVENQRSGKPEETFAIP